MADDADLAELVDRTARDSGLSGVVRVDRAGATIVSASFGLADRRHGIENTPTTRFAIASGAKGFTALTVMSLTVDGLLSPATTARSLLGDSLPLIDDDVTVEHLLGHRSGIGDYLDEEAGGDINDYVMSVPIHELTTTDAFLPMLDGHPQRERPGETFRYNNGGFMVLALLAERATGRPFHDLVDERVIQPAGLTATAFDRSDELSGDVAIGYLHDDGLRSNVLHLPVRGSGDGGIVTTAADVQRLWHALFDGRIVPAAVRNSMMEPRSTTPNQGLRYGLGFYLHPTGSAVVLEGLDAGVSFRSGHDPASATTYTILANTSAGAWPVAAALEAALGSR